MIFKGKIVTAVRVAAGRGESPPPACAASPETSEQKMKSHFSFSYSNIKAAKQNGRRTRESELEVTCERRSASCPNYSITSEQDAVYLSCRSPQIENEIALLFSVKLFSVTLRVERVSQENDFCVRSLGRVSSEEKSESDQENVPQDQTCSSDGSRRTRLITETRRVSSPEGSAVL